MKLCDAMFLRRVTSPAVADPLSLPGAATATVGAGTMSGAGPLRAASQPIAAAGSQASDKHGYNGHPIARRRKRSPTIHHHPFERRASEPSEMICRRKRSGCTSVRSVPDRSCLPQQLWRARCWPAAIPAPSFSRQIRPILVDKCIRCHGPDEASREAGLRLDRKTAAFAGGDSGVPAIVAGDPSESLLFTRITASDVDERMPPPDAELDLDAEEIETIRAWIASGAPWEEHWAFVPPRLPALPPVTRDDWPQTEIDYFILARLEEEGLAPSPEADRETLIRRVTFDLTGLPPTLEEIDAFLVDKSPTAYEKVVDRLLRSQRYGEHMARYWLDVARYGDTHGLHLDNYREMWLYRDWVVQAFNRNLPFDQFVVEQLAGDLLPEPTQEQRIATGFNRCHVTTNEGGAIEEEWYVRNVVDRVVTTGTAFMGLTLECTRCHDHKYDPLTMNDFYSLFAFFNSIDGKPLDGNAAEHPPVERVPTAAQAAELATLERRIAELNDRLSEPWEEVDVRQQQWESHPEPPQSDDGKEQSIPDDVQAALQVAAEARTPAQQTAIRTYYRQHVGTLETLVAARTELSQADQRRKQLNDEVATTLIYREAAEPRPAFLLNRGEYDQKGAERPRTVPAALPPMNTDLPRDRFGLARWLVDPDHPLTARVAVNRIWQQVFGTGIVKTAEDFGTRGERPSHPELLDWLAVRFIAEGWDIKAAMKRIVMSATYRQSSRVTPELFTRDPANRLLARGPRFRLDAEMLRDQALFVADLLSGTSWRAKRQTTSA